MRLLLINFPSALAIHEFVSSETLVVVTNVLLAMVTIAAIRKDSKESRIAMVDIVRLFLGRPAIKRDGRGAHRKGN